ncbi:MAG: hypothetical protein HY299_18105 [Verrucomicrobia bacterium]|nr:hypothetical protein [Verrucomicrobiota bacterium]
MKTPRVIHTLITVFTLAAFSAVGADKIIGGPKGGRLLENPTPRAEFFVEKDRTVTITFYDAALKAVAPGEQTVNVVAEVKSGKVELEFEKKGDVLVSKTPLPEGDGYNVVVQIKTRPDAKPQNFRVKYDTRACGECKRPEYACTCGH